MTTTKRRKSHTVKFRLTRGQFESLNTMSHSKGVSQSEALRMMLNDEVKRITTNH